MNILVSRLDGSSSYHVALISENRDEYETGLDEETIIVHETMFGKPEMGRNQGELLITALARCSDGDDENPGTALENLVKQAFLTGVNQGVKSERERIISRLTDDPDA